MPPEIKPPANSESEEPGQKDLDRSKAVGAAIILAILVGWGFFAIVKKSYDSATKERPRLQWERQSLSPEEVRHRIEMCGNAKASGEPYPKDLGCEAFTD